MIKSYFGSGSMLIVTALLAACGGGGGSENSSTGAPESILGYKLVMTVKEVEIVEYSPTVNLLQVGDTMTLQFVDQNTIYGEEKFHELSHESWDYSANGANAELNLYTSGGEVHFEFESEDRQTGTFVYDGEIYWSGARTRYYGDLAISRIDAEDDNTEDGPSDNVSGVAADLQGKWESACDDGDSVVWEFSGNEMHLSYSVYGTSDCSGSSPESTPRGISANFTIGDQFITDSGLTAYEIDITYTYVAHEDYGIAEGDKYFGIVYEDGNVLYFSDETSGSGSSAPNRPTELDFVTPYYRQ